MNIILVVHVLAVIISICGFIFRGLLRFRDSDLSRARWLKILPHVNDTILIASALLLLNEKGFGLLQAPWLQVKIIALLIYIALGFIAFRFGRSAITRMIAWLLAIVVFFYIIGVAVTKNPLLVA